MVYSYYFCRFSSTVLLHGGSHLNHFLVWALLFHPGTVITYLIDASNLSFGTTYFLSVKDLGSLSFFGQTLWTNAAIGTSLILGNFCLWTYWCWSILKRRFNNPESTILSKVQSYWLTSWLHYSCSRLYTTEKYRSRIARVYR